MLKLIRRKYLNLGQNNLLHSNGITGDLKGSDLTINAVFWRGRVTSLKLYLVQRIPEDLLFVKWLQKCWSQPGSVQPMVSLEREEIAPSADLFPSAVLLIALETTSRILENGIERTVTREGIIYSQVTGAMFPTGADCGWHCSSPQKIALKCNVLRSQLTSGDHLKNGKQKKKPPDL